MTVRGCLVRMVLAAVLSCAVVATTGCGNGSVGGPRPAALAVVDNTPSFQPYSHECIPDFLTVATTVAARSGDFYAGAFVTGDPFRQRFTIEQHFGANVPPAIEGNPTLEDGYRRRQADDLKGPLTALAQSRPDAKGSPILSGLWRATDFRAQHVARDQPFWLVVCSDLADVGDGLDSRAPIPRAALQRALKTWSQRLAGLHGAEVYFIGVGRVRPGSAARPDSIEQVKGLIRRIGVRVGFHVRLMDTQLGDTFPPL